jgi:hypothetical protein
MVGILLRWKSMTVCILHMHIASKGVCAHASRLISLLELNCPKNKSTNVHSITASV